MTDARVPPSPPSESPYGHLKLRHLQLLQLLDRERSITRAATALHLTQPAVSAMLRELESIFGMRLVERSRQGVTLTPQATTALRRFSVALAEVDSAHREARQATRSRSRILRVGALALAMEQLVPDAIATFVADVPDVQIRLVEGTTDTLCDSLMAGGLDLFVGRLDRRYARPPEIERFGQVRLLDEPRYVMARHGHPLASRGRIDFATLAEQGWVMSPHASSMRLAFDDVFIHRGLVPPTPAVESVSARHNVAIAARSDLLALSSMTIARPLIERGRLVRLDTAGPLPGLWLSAIWRRTSEVDAATMRFRDVLVETVRRTA